MLFPASLAYALNVLWIVGGALLGAALGDASTTVLGLARRRMWLDALTGAGAVLAAFGLAGALTLAGPVVSENGRTLGWRGLLFDHLLPWAAGTVVVMVIGRQLATARRERSDHPSAPSRRPSSHGSGQSTEARPCV